MIVGLPPHYNRDRILMYKSIVQKHENYPTSMSANCKDLLIKLLKKNPEERIGIKEIKSHPFCASINWD